MNNGIPRISAVVITYNQENVISRAIDSLLRQRDYLYEICVSDDCSQDRTWDILLEYDRKYPGLFVLNRNNPNKGIFENIEKTWEMPSGDIIYRLAGDDECGDGWFKKVIEFIEAKDIDYKKELFCIYGDYKVIYSNGDSRISHNKAIAKGISPFRLALRQVVSNRSACFNILIMKRYQKHSRGKSHIAENILDRQLQIFSERNYYVPNVGNIYYGRIGVSAHLTDEVKKERLKIWPYTVERLASMGITLTKGDMYYVRHRIALQNYYYWGNKKSAFLSIWYFLRSFDLKIFLASDTMRGAVLAIRRRLPHKHNINME